MPTHKLAHHAKFVDDFVAWVEEITSFFKTFIASDVID